MGIFNRLLGTAAEVNIDKLEKEFETILVEGESIQHAYALIRDLIVFTDKRLVLIDKQGLTGKKQTVLSIPYSSIVKFSKETKGRFETDAEVKIWVRGEAAPTEFEFPENRNVHDVYRVLGSYLLG